MKRRAPSIPNRTYSGCAAVKDEVSLAERVLRCEACGLQIDRDLNAERNLAALVAGSSPETVNACGAGGSGRANGPVQPAAVKQESPSRKLAASAVGNRRP